jgi:hypothetical protein
MLAQSLIQSPLARLADLVTLVVNLLPPRMRADAPLAGIPDDDSYAECFRWTCCG